MIYHHTGSKQIKNQVKRKWQNMNILIDIFITRNNADNIYILRKSTLIARDYCVTLLKENGYKNGRKAKFYTNVDMHTCYETKIGFCAF